MIPTAFWEGLAVGLAVSAVGSLAVWAYLRRRYGGASRLPPAAMRAPAAASRPIARSAPTLVPVARAASATVGAATVPAPAIAAMATRTETPDPPPVNGGAVRISHRVLLHIARLGRIPPEEVQPRALCQAGMVDALGVQQGALTGVLRRLVAAGVLEEHRGHVYGIDRRVKFYRLSPAGVDLCRELRAQGPAPSAIARAPTRNVVPPTLPPVR